MATSLGKNEYTEKYRYVKQHHDEIKTLIIGSSLSSCSFNPFVFGDSVYNFGLPERTLYYDVMLMEQLLPEMNSLKTVIYPLHYNLHLVDPIVCDTTDRLKHLMFQYYRYMNVSSLEHPCQIIYRSAFLSDFFNINSCKNKEPKNPLGYTKMDTSYYGLSKAWKCGNPPSQPNPKECIILLERLAYICHKNNVRLIVYTPPFPDDYITEMTDEGRVNLIRIINTVKKQYPIEYKDYTANTAFRNHTFYLNWNHLNHRGATILAERVKEDFHL